MAVSRQNRGFLHSCLYREYNSSHSWYCFCYNFFFSLIFTLSLVFVVLHFNNTYLKNIVLVLMENVPIISIGKSLILDIDMIINEHDKLNHSTKLLSLFIIIIIIFVDVLEKSSVFDIMSLIKCYCASCSKLLPFYSCDWKQSEISKGKVPVCPECTSQEGKQDGNF